VVVHQGFDEREDHWPSFGIDLDGVHKHLAEHLKSVIVDVGGPLSSCEDIPARRVVRRRVLPWNFPGLVAIADTAIPVQQERGAFLPMRQVFETVLATAVHQGCSALPPWPVVFRCVADERAYPWVATVYPS
jgi:hypothetical protein